MVFYRVKLFSILCLFVTALSAIAQESAYNALNSVGKSKGQPYLDNLLNLEGLNGNSQPSSWLMTFSDPASRSGIREVEVRGGAIISQRTPVNSPYGNAARVNLDRLQLDSDGAFTVAEQEAARQQISFSTAGYLLQSDSTNGTPVWRVQLFNSSGALVQTLRISADNGSVLGGRGPVAPRSRDDYASSGDSAPVNNSEEVSIADQPDGPNDSTELKIHRSAVRAKRNVKNAFKHFGGSLQELFTGRRTVDKNLPGE